MGEDEQSTWTFSIKMPDGTMLPFSGTIESAEVADMERKIKVGDKVKVTQVSVRVGGTYKVGDILTVTETFGSYPGYIRTSKGILSPDEYEIITDEIKAGDTVTLIDKPWEWDGWAKLPRPLRLIYIGLMGKEYALEKIMNSVKVSYLQNTICADIDGLYIIPLAILRKVETVEAKHRYTDEQIKEAKCYLAEKTFDGGGWTITKPTAAHPVAVVSGPLGTGTAKCAPDDEFNAYIGLMVAFKRYHDEPLPTWIRG